MKNKLISKTISSILFVTVIAYTTPVFAFTREETVYSKTSPNGDNYNAIVNNHIKNNNKESIIEDLSDLLNIKNVNGDEEFKQDGNKLIWNANGNDIYYQGETKKELPIQCNIKYELNGEEITAQELAGKSGKVKITIQYTNKEAHIVSINGKSETLYTPFIAVCGTIINNENNKNIEITNGKVIDEGNKTIVMGISLPGLQESLNISKEKIEIPSNVEITMETTDFELNNIITFITPKVIEKQDLEIFDKIDEIYNQVNTLQNSSKQLVKGAETLREGTNTYNEKSKEFNSAMKQISNGVGDINENYTKINNGISEINKNTGTLQAGAKTVNQGTQAISENLEIISEKLGELQSGTKKLQDGEEQINAGIKQIIEKLNTISTSDNSNKITELKKLVKTNQATIDNLKLANTQLNTQLTDAKDEETKKTIKTQIETNKSLITLLETNIKANQNTINTLEATDATQIETLKSGLQKIEAGIDNIKTGTNNLYNGQNAIKKGTDTLASKSKELSEGTKSLYQGTQKISEGSKTLYTGSTQMKQGIEKLDTSTQKITEANGVLTEGSYTISEGINTLSDGINKFDKEGIEKICNYINGNVKDITTRLKKIEELSEEYNSFTMIDDKNQGNVKFIIIADSIKKQEDSKQEIIVEDKTKENE